MIFLFTLCFYFYSPISYASPSESKIKNSTPSASHEIQSQQAFENPKTLTPSASHEAQPHKGQTPLTSALSSSSLTPNAATVAVAEATENIEDPYFIKEKQRIQKELFEATDKALTNELKQVAEELKAFLPQALKHLDEKVSTYGRKKVVQWAKGYTNEHKRLTFAYTGESKINWVSTEDKKSQVPAQHKEAFILKIDLYSAPHLAFIVYDPRQISPETNPHLQKYIARIHVNRDQHVILLGVRDGQLVTALGETLPSHKISHKVLQSPKAFRNNLRNIGKWWGEKWRAVWVPPSLNDVSLATAAAITNATTAGMTIGIQYLTNQAMNTQGPQADPKVMALSFGFAMFFGVFNNTYLEWTTKGSHFTQYLKSFTSTLPYNLWALTLAGQSINPLTVDGRMGWATAIGVGVLANMVKPPMNKAWRIRNDKRVMTDNFSIPIPFSQKTIGLSKSRAQYQIIYRQIFEVPKLLALLGLGVFSVKFLNTTIDGGDILLLASGAAWYRYALYQAEKHNHRDQVQLRRAWNAMVYPVTESLGILKDTLTKGPRKGAARSRLALKHIRSEIAAPLTNKIKNICQSTFGKKQKTKPSQKLSKENLDQIISELSPL